MANKATAQREWLLVDAENEVLGRLASKVAYLVRGKHKPTFTPHVNCGDQVIVINADKIRLTGSKLADKEYQRYSLYPGGQTVEKAKDLKARKPEALVENAVRHGIGRREGPGRVILKSRREGAALRIEVRDDGPGFPSGWELASVAGVGLGNTRERLARIYPDSHRLEAGNGADGGASVRLEVPFHRRGDEPGRVSG